jgi:hypothetical protein
MQWHPQIPIDIADQSLDEECAAQHKTELLEQRDMGLYMNFRIQIVQVQADDDRHQDQHYVDDAITFAEVLDPIEFRDEKGRQEKGRTDQ